MEDSIILPKHVISDNLESKDELITKIFCSKCSHKCYTEEKFNQHKINNSRCFNAVALTQKCKSNYTEEDRNNSIEFVESSFKHKQKKVKKKIKNLNIYTQTK